MKKVRFLFIVIQVIALIYIAQTLWSFVGYPSTGILVGCILIAALICTYWIPSLIKQTKKLWA